MSFGLAQMTVVCLFLSHDASGSQHKKQNTRRKATCVEFSRQRTVSRGILVQVEFGVRHRGVEHAFLQRRWTSQETHEELCGCCVEGPGEEDWLCESDGSMESGVTCEEPIVLELDEHTEELQNVFASMGGVRFDPEPSRASRKVEELGNGQGSSCG